MNATTLILDYLRRNEGLTARQISEATGVAYSTVTDNLRALVDEGTTAKRDGKWYITEIARDERDDRDEPDAPIVVPTAYPTTAPEATTVNLPEQSDVESVLAFMKEARPMPEVEDEQDEAPAPRTRRSNGEASQRVAPVRDQGLRPWARGELKNRITALLQDERDSVWGATDVTKRLNEARGETDPVAQAGSVEFALKTLAAEGVASVVQDKPRRYQAA